MDAYQNGLKAGLIRGRVEALTQWEPELHRQIALAEAYGKSKALEEIRQTVQETIQAASEQAAIAHREGYNKGINDAIGMTYEYNLDNYIVERLESMLKT